ncbi:hypothetical protein HPP92_016600 [Vanilla planifolia]|uniref:Uncharacterized protein n=1 Tax=Vanilla planifolia TaxID=51239 RepID=A0A835QGE4_VANPL|nr:hypothetical protein HPP92_016600 [Vanilla planifolia]
MVNRPFQNSKKASCGDETVSTAGGFHKTPLFLSLRSCKADSLRCPVLVRAFSCKSPRGGGFTGCRISVSRRLPSYATRRRRTSFAIARIAAQIFSLPGSSKMGDSTSQDGRDEEDDEDYDEAGGGNRLLGFMFGNVDNSGDLDVDYLDEDAKEHLSALVDKLGHSLTDIDLIKSSPATTDASEQDYDEKAEDAIDYEDIDEQYDGPEVHVTTEEDHLLPKKEYFSSDVFLSSLNKTSVFDEEDYDEDEEIGQEDKIKENKIQIVSLTQEGGDLEIIPEDTLSYDDSLPPGASLESEEMAFELVAFEEDQVTLEENVDTKSETPLPVLCMEDGLAILRFSEIFGIHEPLKKTDGKCRQKRTTANVWDKTFDIEEVAEEDEEAFLRSSGHELSVAKMVSLDPGDVGEETDQTTSHTDLQNKNVCLASLPMKDDSSVVSEFEWSLPSPKFYPLDQQEWEDAIIWGNSPQSSNGRPVNDEISELETEDQSEHSEDGCWRRNEKDGVMLSSVGLSHYTGSGAKSVERYWTSSAREYRLELPLLESFSRSHGLHSEMKAENGHAKFSDSVALHGFDNLSSLNKDLVNGFWLDNVIWDADQAISKPKLILDLQDKQMLFEILDDKQLKDISSRAGAMMVVRSSMSNLGESTDQHNQGLASVARFNISNDKYYSNRKISQQVKSNAKKRGSHGIKNLHSVPALRLQTMKPRLSNKEIANFHKPKALWYPHDNEIVAKAQGALCTCGPIKVVIMTLGGKGAKLHVDADETLFSVKIKASKKLEFRMSEKVKVFILAKSWKMINPFCSRSATKFGASFCAN